MTGREVDVRELEAPEPLRLVLQSLHELPPAGFVHVLHRREAHCLLAAARELGFEGQARRISPERVDLWLWRVDDPRAERAALDDAGAHG